MSKLKNVLKIASFQNTSLHRLHIARYLTQAQWNAVILCKSRHGNPSNLLRSSDVRADTSFSSFGVRHNVQPSSIKDSCSPQQLLSVEVADGS